MLPVDVIIQQGQMRWRMERKNWQTTYDEDDRKTVAEK